MAPPSHLRADTQLSPPAPRDASRSQSDSSIASASPRAGSKKRRGDSNAQLQDESKVVAKRKPWSVLKKEEKELLLKEAKYLEAQIDFLQHLPKNTTGARILERSRRENKTLQAAARAQQCDLAGVQSALTSYMMTQRSPFERFIHLKRDLNQRRAALLELKDETLRDAERYLNERSRHFDPMQKISSMDKFTTSSGDFVIQSFEMMPLGPEVCSIKQVFDALRFFYFNMDISLMEPSGELVVRKGKDDALVEQNVCQQRIIRSASSGLQIESNCVVTSSYCPKDSENGFGREYAIITICFVDEDELHPYRPTERLRQDLTATVTLRTFPRKVSPVGDGETRGGGGGDEVFEVVLCRSYFSKLYHSKTLEVPEDLVDNTVIAAEMCSKEALRTVYGVVRGLTASV